MINSIKLKFFVWFVIIFAIIFAGLGGFLHYEFKTFTLNQIDKQLSASFHTIASPIVLEASQGQLPMELWELEMSISLLYRYQRNRSCRPLSALTRPGSGSSVNLWTCRMGQ